jgi:hypothetical protein
MAGGSVFKAQALDFLKFVNASPTRNHDPFFLWKSLVNLFYTNDAIAFHAVSSARQRLSDAGFKEIKVPFLTPWRITPGPLTRQIRRKNPGPTSANPAESTM